MYRSKQYSLSAQIIPNMFVSTSHYQPYAMGTWLMTECQYWELRTV